MNYPPISTHLTPGWEQPEDQWFDVKIEYAIDDEDELHEENMSVCCYPSEDEIRQTCLDTLYVTHPQAKEIEITYLNILDQ